MSGLTLLKKALPCLEMASKEDPISPSRSSARTLVRASTPSGWRCCSPVPAGRPGTSSAGVSGTASPRGIQVTQQCPKPPGGVRPHSPQSRDLRPRPVWYLPGSTKSHVAQGAQGEHLQGCIFVLPSTLLQDQHHRPPQVLLVQNRVARELERGVLQLPEAESQHSALGPRGPS